MTRPHRSTRRGTLGELLEYIAPLEALDSEQILSWPPDVFALVGTVLHCTGAYTCVTRDWPPSQKSLHTWCQDIVALGRTWRRGWRLKRRAAPPRPVAAWWHNVVERATTPLSSVPLDEELCHALVQLIAAADEAAIGVGIPPLGDMFEQYAAYLLHGVGDAPSTLCTPLIDPEKVRVLPKLHTTETGLSFRSMSHNLALVPLRDVVPVWRQAPFKTEVHTMNILLVPWPKQVVPNQFAPAPRERLRRAWMPPEFGLFQYTPARAHGNLITHLRSLLIRAEQVSGGIDMVVFPELSLSLAQYESVQRLLAKERRETILIAGVCEPARNAQAPSRNYVAIHISSPALHSENFQRKHHRWKLDRDQVIQYGLGGRLNPMEPVTRGWWEDCETGPRQLFFVATSAWLTFCALVCEDLARQDPVAELIRSVGPNLVVALLMDGPQLPSRWPGRYASVLADDPGCSVLTLTSAGMMRLSRPRVGTPASTAVALWKDAKQKDAVPIELPKDADGIILSLAGDRSEEFTADGRRDEAMAAFPIFAGVHAV